MGLRALLLLASALLGAQADRPLPPAIGTLVSNNVAQARRGASTCYTAPAHYDPCAQITLSRTRYVIAWDEATRKITYIFTSDPNFLTDSELGVGGTVRVNRGKLISYKNWFLASDWTDSASGAGEPSTEQWYPVVTLLDLPSPDPNVTEGEIAGFVQSRYVSAASSPRQ